MNGEQNQPQQQPTPGMPSTPEKKKGSMTWVIVILALIIIVAVVLYVLGVFGGK